MNVYEISSPVTAIDGQAYLNSLDRQSAHRSQVPAHSTHSCRHHRVFTTLRLVASAQVARNPSRIEVKGALALPFPIVCYPFCMVAELI